jgi:hypothetical protein
MYVADKTRWLISIKPDLKNSSDSIVAELTDTKQHRGFRNTLQACRMKQAHAAIPPAFCAAWQLMNAFRIDSPICR